MTRGQWIALLSLLISAVITHGSLWIRGIKPSKRVGLWESFIWQLAPKDEQTAKYLNQGMLTAIVVLPVTLLVLTVLAGLYGQ